MAPEPSTRPTAKQTEQVVFDVAMEGLYVKGIAGRITPALRAKLKAAGLDLEAKLRPTYGRDVWVRCLELTAGELFPAVPVDGALRLVGHAAVEGTANTLIGKTILSMARLIGPRRALGRLKDAFGSVNNFIVCRHTELAPNEHRLWLNDCYGRPTYMQGVLEAALTATGAKGLKVDQLAREGEAVTFGVTWE